MAEVVRPTTAQVAIDRHTDEVRANPAAHTVGSLELSLDVSSADTVVIKVSGDVDLGSAPDLEGLAIRCLERYQPRQMVLDLTAVQFMGTAGLSLLLRLQDDATCRRVDLQIVAVNRVVRRPIELLSLEGQLNLTSRAPDLRPSTDT